jgi:hypothetical protein
MRLPSVRKWLAWIGALGAGALVLHAADSRSLFPDPIIAKGKGFEIRQSDVEQAVISLKATMATQGQTIPPAQMSSVESRMLDRMILTRILMQRATDADKAKAREEADRFIANTRSRAPSEESYRRQLIAVGIKPEVFEARAYEQAIVETLIRREIRDTITIPDADVRAAYDEGLDALARDVRATIQKMEASGQTNNQFYADARARFADLTRANLARLDRPETVRSAVIMVHTVDTLTREPLTAEQRAEKPPGPASWPVKTSPGSPGKFRKTRRCSAPVASTRPPGLRWACRNCATPFSPSRWARSARCSPRARGCTWSKCWSGYPRAKCPSSRSPMTSANTC